MTTISNINDMKTTKSTVSAESVINMENGKRQQKIPQYQLRRKAE